jgi:tetratricopeptide (TPR) repeat protein
LVTFFTSVQAFAGRPLAPEDFVPIKLLAAITSAKTLTDLERLHAGVIAPDHPTEIAYGLRLLELGDRKKAERVLLTSIPKNQIEYVILTLIGDACQREGIQLSAAVCMIPDTYLAALCRIVARHPSYYGAYLTLSYFADGELKEQLDHWNRAIERSNRKAYIDALRELPEAVRRTVCGECVDELQR